MVSRAEQMTKGNARAAIRAGFVRIRPVRLTALRSWHGADGGGLREGRRVAARPRRNRPDFPAAAATFFCPLRFH
jgi:hypothetical protein